MRCIVLALALCFTVGSLEAKPVPAPHKVKAKKIKSKGRKAVKHPTVHRTASH